MTNTVQTPDVTWGGLYSWPGFEEDTNLSAIPKTPGVYIMAFEYKDGYLIYGVGIKIKGVGDK